MSDARRGADVIAEALAAAGARFAFGVPGGEVLSLLDALERAGIRFVLARHETPAGYMAEGAYRAGGGLPVALATLGPGAANLANAVANAAQEAAPLIALTGCVGARSAATYTHQIFDHRAMMAPLAKATLRAPQGAVGATLARAIALATAGRPGPVHVDVSVEVAEAACDEPRVAPIAAAALGAASPAAIASARRALARAERPLVLSGLGALDEASVAAVRALADLHVPVLTTYRAKGVVDESHPSSLGAFGLSPAADALLLPLVRRADAVLLAGYDPIEVREGWREPFGPRATVIDVGCEPATHGFHRIDAALVGDAGATLGAIAEGLEPRAPWPEVATLRAAVAARFASDAAWGPGAIFDVAAAVVPARARLAVDTGAHRILMCQSWRCAAPRMLLQSVGFGTMGCAVPMAIGARLAEPDRPAVAFVGDGGLEMVLGELATARDVDAGLVIVVIDDRSLALIEQKQRARGLANAGVDGGGTDYASLARACGGRGMLARSREALADALREAIHDPGPFTLIHCPIERRAYDGAI